jgi:hypothetical protein
MDLSKIRSIVFNELTNRNGLHSLKLQNHIYGCFIIMEDIAQGMFDFSNNILSTPKYSFDLDKQFPEIGLRYGFAMDSNLALDTFNSEYKETWLECFNDINKLRDINQSDRIEDMIIELVQSTVKEEESFFIHALESGSLPQEWIEKVFLFIKTNNNIVSTEKEVEVEVECEVEVKKTALTNAVSEKPLNVRHRLATTRRNKKAPINIKKSLSKTRRH